MYLLDVCVFLFFSLSLSVLSSSSVGASISTVVQKDDLDTQRKACRGLPPEILEERSESIAAPQRSLPAATAPKPFDAFRVYAGVTVVPPMLDRR